MKKRISSKTTNNGLKQKQPKETILRKLLSNPVIPPNVEIPIRQRR